MRGVLVVAGKRVISREGLVGKEVYTLRGVRVGSVRDIGFVLDEEGGGGLCLIVSLPSGGDVEVPVSEVKAIGDIVLLSEDFEVPEEAGSPAGSGVGDSTATPQLLEGESISREDASAGVRGLAPEPRGSSRLVARCPKCNSSLVYVPGNQKWYCYNCKTYIDLPLDIVSQVPKCPECGLPLSFIEQYGRWYCYNCRRYVEEIE